MHMTKILLIFSGKDEVRDCRSTWPSYFDNYQAGPLADDPNITVT